MSGISTTPKAQARAGRSASAFTQTDWYRYPFYYDIVFDGDTPREADFLEGVFHRHGRLPRGEKITRVLEPACGSGRMLFELARRGHAVAGFDASPEMVDYAQGRLCQLPTGLRRASRVRVARMESFRMRGPFHLAHCLLSTFKYLLTEDDALAHLKRVAGVLTPGGIYVIGIHLTDYTRTRTDREVWRGTRDNIHVRSETITRPASSESRLEWLRNRLLVRDQNTGRTEKLETHWQCRTYDSVQLESLLQRVPSLQIAGCYDFSHDIEVPRGLDDTQEDLVVVLRKRSR